MQKRLLFFNVFLLSGENITDYPVHRYIDNLIGLRVEDRFRTIKDTNYKINAVEADNLEQENDRAIWFCKYRDDKPFVGNSSTDDTDPIDSDVIEPTIFTYISSSHLLVMGYNNYGPSHKVLEEYLNSFINIDSENKDLKFVIVPVKTENQMELIRNAEYINSIEIEYKVDDADYSNLIQGEYADKPIIISAFEDNAKVSRILDSKIGVLRFKKGRFKSPIKMPEALALLSNINSEDDIIRDVKVEIKDAFSKYKVISLKNNGNLYKYIEVQGNAFDHLRERIKSEYYEDLEQPASNNFRNFELLNMQYKNIIN